MTNGGRNSKFNSDVLKELDCNGDLIESWCEAAFKPEDALCKYCNVIISCKHHGSAAVKRHAKNSKHIEVCNKNRSGGKLQKQSQKRLDFSANRVLVNSHSDNIYTAEVMFTVAMASENVPYSFSDTATAIFPKIFSDSKIAKDFKCSRAKASYLVSDGIGPNLKEQLIKDINDSDSFYTIQVDETPISEKRVQQMDVIVRFYSEKWQEVTVQHLESFHLGHGTAVNIFDCITDALQELNKTKLLCFFSDGPKVMISVKKKMKDLNPELIDLSTCCLHKVHNGFSAALNAFGGEVETLIVDLYYFFKRSSAKCEDFNSIQAELGLDEKVLINHSTSRWLTLHNSVSRFIELFAALMKYFKKETTKERSDSIRLRRINEAMRDGSLLPKALFLRNVSDLLNKYLGLFQTEAPLIHILYDEMVSLVKQLMGRFLSGSYFNELNGEELMLLNVEKSEHWKTNVEVGMDTVKALSKLSQNEKKKFYLGARSFYLACTKYLLKSLPLGNKILKHLQILHPLMRTEDTSLKSIKYLAAALPNIVQASDVALLADEWIRLQSEQLEQDLQTETKSRVRIDHYWRNIFALNDNLGHSKYLLLSKLVKALLCLAHGNADVERAFSINKHMLENRTNLNIASINGLRQVKSYISQIGGVKNFKVTPSLLRSARSSYKQYCERLEKEKKEVVKRKIAKEDSSKLIDSKAQEVELQKQLKASQEMLNNAERSIEAGLKKKNMSLIESGQVLLKEAKTKIEKYLKELDEIRKQISEVSSSRKKPKHK